MVYTAPDVYEAGGVRFPMQVKMSGLPEMLYFRSFNAGSEFTIFIVSKLARTYA